MFTDLSSNLFRRVLGTLSLTILSHLFEIWDRRMTIKSCQGCGPSFDGTSYFNTWGFSNSSVDTGLHPFQSSSKWWSCQKSRQKLWAKMLGAYVDWDGPWRSKRGGPCMWTEGCPHLLRKKVLSKLFYGEVSSPLCENAMHCSVSRRQWLVECY